MTELLPLSAKPDDPQEIQPRPKEDSREYGISIRLPFSTPFLPPRGMSGRKEELYEVFSEKAEDEPDILQLQAMRRTDGQARALYRLITLPIRSALRTAKFVPTEDGDEEADFIEQMLTLPYSGGGMQTPMRTVVAQMLMAVFDGYSAFEQVLWRPKRGPLKGKWTLRKIAHRPSETVTFITDDHGDFKGIRQRTVIHGREVDEFIDDRSALYFAVQEEERPFYGVSYFQSAFHHFDKKVKLYYIAHLSAQHRAVGSRIGTVPLSASDKEKNDFLKHLEDFGFAQAIVKPEKFEVEHQYPTNSADFLELINHHNSQMSKSVLAAFFDDSQGGGADNALVDFGKQSDSMFVMMLQALMDDMAALINEKLTPKFIDWNFGSEKYPEFTWGTFTNEQKEMINDTFGLLSVASTTQVTPEFIFELEKYMAEELGFEIDYDEIEKQRAADKEKQDMQAQEAGQFFGSDGGFPPKPKDQGTAAKPQTGPKGPQPPKPLAQPTGGTNMPKPMSQPAAPVPLSNFGNPTLSFASTATWTTGQDTDFIYLHGNKGDVGYHLLHPKVQPRPTSIEEVNARRAEANAALEQHPDGSMAEDFKKEIQQLDIDQKTIERGGNPNRVQSFESALQSGPADADQLASTPSASAVPATADNSRVEQAGLPEGVAEIVDSTPEDQGLFEDSFVVEALDADGNVVGNLEYTYDPHRRGTPEVSRVNVDEGLRGRGVATALMAKAREREPALKHSVNQTDAGKGFAKSDPTLGKEADDPRVAARQAELRDIAKRYLAGDENADKPDQGPQPSFQSAPSTGRSTATEPGGSGTLFFNRPGRPDGSGEEDDPIDVQGDIEQAAKLLAEGKHIRLNRPDEVSTLLDKLAATVADAKEKGEDAPTYDLCKVSVPGTNLFCSQSKGIPRAQMPQLGGQAVPGTRAASLTPDKKGEVDVTEPFIQALEDSGVSIEEQTVPAERLKASQNELDGPKVAGISGAMAAGKIPDKPIFVTRDGYVIDGHHRWAAKVALDVQDGKLGDISMPVRVVDMDIGEALDFANKFTRDYGIKPKGLGAAAEGVTPDAGDDGQTNAPSAPEAAPEAPQEGLSDKDWLVPMWGDLMKRAKEAGVDVSDFPDDPSESYADRQAASQERLKAKAQQREADKAKDAEIERKASLANRRVELLERQASRGFATDEMIQHRLERVNAEGRPDAAGTPEDPIDAGDDLDKAVKLLAEGKSIRLDRVDKVGTLLKKLAATVEDAKAKGEDAPTYDLCKVSVPGTNLFCVESKGVPRTKMPQLGGVPRPGSRADSLEKDKKGEVDIADDFGAALERQGIGVTEKRVKAASLKATQENLDGPKVAGISGAMKAGKIPDKPIYVTRDGYVIDGHHRWASKVAIDVEDGKLGDIDMPVKELDMDIGQAIDFANIFASAYGIQPKGLGKDSESAGGANLGQTKLESGFSFDSDADRHEFGDLSRPEQTAYAYSRIRNGMSHKAAVMRAKEVVAQQKPSPGSTLAQHLDANGMLTPERQKVHDKIVDEFLSGKQSQAEPEMLMVMGGMAAGKSSLSEDVGDDHVLVNPDDVRTKLPEYDQMVKAGDRGVGTKTHQEAMMLASRIMREAMRRRTHVTWDMSGAGPSHEVRAKIEGPKKQGYKVRGRYATVPTSLALTRAESRGKATGRFVPPDILRESHASVSRNFPDVFDAYDGGVEVYDTDTKKGAKPLPIFRYINGKRQVLDAEAYQAFLAKSDETEGIGWK